MATTDEIYDLRSLVRMMHCEDEVACLDGGEWWWFSRDYDGDPHWRTRPLTQGEADALAFVIS